MIEKTAKTDDLKLSRHPIFIEAAMPSVQIRYHGSI